LAGDCLVSVWAAKEEEQDLWPKLEARSEKAEEAAKENESARLIDYIDFQINHSAGPL